MEIMWSVGSIPMHFRQIILRIADRLHRTLVGRDGDGGGVSGNPPTHIAFPF